MTPSNSQSKRWSNRSVFLMLGLAVILVWGKSLTFDFVSDDRYYIEMNEALRSPSSVFAIFTKASAQKSMSPYPYRPLRTLHYAILTWISGQPRAVLFHTANLIWHLGVAYLLYILTLLLLQQHDAFKHQAQNLALASALLFCVHPITSEVVVWAKCLDDLMATAFILASFIAAFRAWPSAGRMHSRWGVSSVLFFAAALYSKESVAALILLYAFFWFQNPPRRAFFGWFASQTLVLAVFLFSRRVVLGHTQQVDAPLSGSYTQTLLDMIPISHLYLKSFFGIPPFLPIYAHMAGGYTFFSWPVATGLLSMLMAFILFLWALQKKIYPLCFGIGWISCSILPVSNLIPMMQYFAERFVYLPLIGFIIVLVVLVGFFVRSPTVSRPIGLALIVFWAATSFFAADKWKSELSLTQYAYKSTPLTTYTTLNYLITLDESGNYDGFKQVLNKHRKSIENHPRGKWLISRDLLRQNQREASLNMLQSVEDDFSDNPDYLLTIGVIYAESGKFENAISYFRRVTQMQPSYSEGWKNLGLTQNQLGKYRAGIAAFQRSLRLAPEDINAWQGLAYAAWHIKNFVLARQAFESLASLEPNNPSHRYWLNKLVAPTGVEPVSPP